MEEIKIPLNKEKIFLLLLISTLIIGFSLSLWSIDFNFTFFDTILSIIAILISLFFGFVFLKSFQKIMSNEPGLTVNQHGIINNSSSFSIGLIPWEDIKEIKTNKVGSQNIITLVLHNPNDYIIKQKGYINSKRMNLNLRKFGSPINILQFNLDSNFENVLEILLHRIKEHNDKPQISSDNLINKT